ncbi:hypothetical protein ABID23_000498 [Bartonella silvatica]|uniref:Organic solvent tolerance-like N-terminal domain-containing protein n=1 Tax=Bartonella silvatica TaxID=357760 RepID=A0ABV2HFU0_9HYPH
MLRCIHAVIIAALWNIGTVSSFAATIKNTDLKVQSLIIVEGSVPFNISLDAHQVATICMKGCFITFPNKDRFAIKAEDNIEISGDRAIFK